MLKRNKYRNIKTVIDGITFDSKHEAARYEELKLLQRAGVIRDLELQQPFELIPTQHIGKETYRKCVYWADFVYYNNRLHKMIVEDAKGMKTDVYKIKKLLMLYIYHIEIQEV